jgi:putative SOS response-associated peptidase YedK
MLGASWNGPDLPPGYNIAPSQPVLAVREIDHKREAILLRWGLIPSWATGKAASYKMINVRAESVMQRPAFRSAFKHRRCLIPADGFYEWKEVGAGKQPYYVHRADGGPVAFAGLWEHWQSAREVIESCAIVTTQSSDVLKDIHNRMPVIVPPGDYHTWLREGQSPLLLEQLMRPTAMDTLEAYPVANSVNNPGHQGAHLIEPV